MRSTREIRRTSTYSGAFEISPTSSRAKERLAAPLPETPGHGSSFGELWSSRGVYFVRGVFFRPNSTR